MQTFALVDSRVSKLTAAVKRYHLRRQATFIQKWRATTTLSHEAQVSFADLRKQIQPLVKSLMKNQIDADAALKQHRQKLKDLMAIKAKLEAQSAAPA